MAKGKKRPAELPEYSIIVPELQMQTEREWQSMG